jgi:DNA-binding CsgD family transcriptional regulator
MGNRRSTYGDPLDEMEIKMLQYAANGYSLNLIARYTQYSYSTVREYFQGIRIKLGATNTVHAVTLAIRKGLIR